MGRGGINELKIKPSGAETETFTGPDITDVNAETLIIIVNVSAYAGAQAGISPKLMIKDPFSGNYFTVWTAAAAISAIGTYAYLFDIAGSGAVGDYTEAVALRLTKTWHFEMDHPNADSRTYSVHITAFN